MTKDTKPIRRRKKKEVNVKLLISLVSAIVSTVILINLILSLQTNDEREYLNRIQQIWNKAREYTKEYDTYLTKWKKGELTNAEIINITQTSIEEKDRLINELNSTKPPERLKNAHEYIILSLKYEKDSNTNILKYIESNDKKYLEESNVLFNKAFEYEGKAIGEFLKAGVNIGSRSSDVRVSK